MSNPLAQLLATAATAALLPVAALAQQIVVLDPIVIPGALAPIAADPAGASVSKLGAAALRGEGSTRLAAALARLPGLSQTAEGPFGNRSTLRIRGLDGRYQAVLVDGIRVDDPTAPTVAFDWGSQLAAGTAQVEVLRGSQSAHWGGSAVAGVVSISTLAGLEEGLHQSGGVEAGRYGTARLSYGLTQKTDRAELALNLSHLRTDGFSAAAAGTEPDGAEATRLSFAGRFQATDALTVGGAVFAQRTRQDYDGYTSSFTLGDTNDEQTRRERGARLYAEVDTGGGIQTFEVATYHVDRDFDEAFGTRSYAGNRLTLGWQGRSLLTPDLTLAYGADWTRERASYSALPGGSHDSDVTGAWVQAIWAPTEALDLAATLRRDRNSDYGGFTTGKLAFAWRPAPGTTVRGALATGFRAPSIDERYGDYGTFVGNPNLTPEKSRSLEFGIDQEFATGARLSATLFRLELDDLIRPDFSGSVGTLQNLPGRTVSKGLELGVTAPLGESIDLGLAYTLTDARSANGDRLTRVPRHNLTLTLDGRLGERLSGQLAVTRVADRYDNDANTFALVKMPDYTVASARISYALTDQAEAWLRVENLTDAVYQTIDGYSTSRRAVYVGIGAKF